MNNTKIAKLNDLFRKNLSWWELVYSESLLNLDIEERREILDFVGLYNTFNENNDPYGEHDFWVFVVKGIKYFWKIDYYDKSNREYLSSNPADPSVTHRVLTIALLEEY